jgi:hypothetical protein
MKKLHEVLKRRIKTDAPKTSSSLVEKPLRGATQKCVGNLGENGCG